MVLLAVIALLLMGVALVLRAARPRRAHVDTHDALVRLYRADDVDVYRLSRVWYPRNDR